MDQKSMGLVGMDLEGLRSSLELKALRMLPDGMPIEHPYIKVMDTVDLTIYEGIKRAHDCYDPRKSVTGHVTESLYENRTDTIEADAARMRELRKYAQGYRQALHDVILEESGRDIPELAEQSMHETKAHGYQINDMRYQELEAIGSLPVIKKIAGRQICDSKRVKDADFIQMMKEYEEWVDKLHDSMVDDESILFYTTDYFNLECLYNIDILYAVADAAERRGVKDKDIDADRMLYSILGRRTIGTEWGDCFAQNRMLHIRQKFVPELFGEPDEYFHWVYSGHLLLKIQLYNYFRIPLHEIVKEYPVEEQARFVREHFWIWDVRPRKKEWTRKKIRIARKIYRGIMMDVGDKPKATDTGNQT